MPTIKMFKENVQIVFKTVFELICLVVNLAYLIITLVLLLAAAILGLLAKTIEILSCVGLVYFSWMWVFEFDGEGGIEFLIVVFMIMVAANFFEKFCSQTEEQIGAKFKQLTEEELKQPVEVVKTLS